MPSSIVRPYQTPITNQTPMVAAVAHPEMAYANHRMSAYKTRTCGRRVAKSTMPPSVPRQGDLRHDS